MSATSSPQGRKGVPSEMAGRARAWRRLALGQQVQRAGGGAHGGGRDLQVARGGGQAAMAQQQLNRAHVGARFQQMRCERMAQRVPGDGLETLHARCALRQASRTASCVIGRPGMSPGNSRASDAPRSSTSAAPQATVARASRIDPCCPCPDRSELPCAGCPRRRPAGAWPPRRADPPRKWSSGGRLLSRSRRPRAAISLSTWCAAPDIEQQ